MRIAVCEDNELHREIITHMLNRCAMEHSISLEVIPYELGMNLLYDVEEGVLYDAVFLDIYLKDTMGNKLARGLRAAGFEGKLVFFTASPDFAIEGYDVNAVGYLLKPVEHERLKTVMGHIMDGNDPESYQVCRRGTVIRIPHHDILYVESCNSKCLIHTVPGAIYTVYKTLNTVEKELGCQSFLRCHQSFLVNMDHVEQVEKQFVMSNGDAVPIRQRGIKPIRLAYMEYAASRSVESTTLGGLFAD